MKKGSRKILKSVLEIYAFVALVLFVALMAGWEYRSHGFISHWGYRIYGEEARTTVWLLMTVSIGGLVYYTTYFIIVLRNRRKRESYLKELAKRPDTLICPHCCEPFLGTQTGESTSCPKCGRTEIEELEGFFDRHPARRAKCPNAHILERGGDA
jgi:hypothetical protein